VRVLCDRHQADLLYAMQRLFEDRLGMELYVPVGRGWWDERYWQFGSVFGDDRLAKQYLDVPVRDLNGQGVVFDPCHPERPIRTVTLEQFRDLDDWGLVVATVQENQPGFHRLASEIGAEYVVQCGNTGQYIDWSLDPLVLSSSEMELRGRGVLMHQEMDVQRRSPDEADRTRVSSFVNLVPRIPTAVRELESLRPLLPNHSFYVYGHEGPDGFVTPVRAIEELMAASGWGWHHKPQGDGFGHVIHGWAAVGRPLVGPSRYYEGKIARPLWEDGVTCVDTSYRSMEDVAAAVEVISGDPDVHAEMCSAIRSRLDELVDYDREEREIRALLGV
jgi:hypothetical protein